MIKSIEKIIKEIKKKIRLFKKVQIGDLVWAKMPLSKNELENIPKSHQVRPYLIVHKNFFSVYAYYASSKKPKNFKNYENYGISKDRYGKARNTWICLNEAYKIPFYNLKSKFSSLDISDLRSIEKRLQIFKNRGKEIKYTFKKDVCLAEGDIICLNHLMYYIYATDSVNLYTYRLFKKTQNKTFPEVIINRKKYFINVNEKCVFKRDIEVKIIDIASFEERDSIKDIKKSLKPKKKEKNVGRKNEYELGTVFQAGQDKIVYLYELDGVYYGVDSIMYQMFPRILKIYNAEVRQIIDICDNENCKKILETLVLNNIGPKKTIKKLYDKVVSCVNY